MASPRGKRNASHGASNHAPNRGSARSYPRTARLNELLREVIAEELERIGDDRLGLVTITGITVDPDLKNAKVWVSALTVDGGVDAVSEALAQHRVPLQAAVARQIRMKRTPLLTFVNDPAITNGQRIESILRDLPRGPELDDDGMPVEPPTPADDAPGAAGPAGLQPS
jgi:ribosome-binding factor A